MPESSDPLELMRNTPEEYGQTFYTHLLEQYKLYVEMADRISARRHAANTYFLTTNTLLVSVAGLLFDKELSEAFAEWQLAVPLAGLALCVTWYFLIRSYRQINTGKFNVVHELERHLPAAPYDAEWNALDKGENWKVYWPFSHVEQFVPVIFSGLYGVLLVLLAV